MDRMRIVSWNVNGLRAVYNKGLMEWMASEDADLVCLQETRVAEEQVPDGLRSLDGYQAFFASAAKRGYSGVALLTRRPPIKISRGLGVSRFDDEGRVLVAQFPHFALFNVYFPNGKASAERLQFKLDFYDAFLDVVEAMSRAGVPVVVCGDVNTAHTEIDLARPKENAKISGFLPQERAWIDRFVGCGFADTFRLFSAEGGQYTWWDMKTGARTRNIGWRIDYFFVSESLRANVKAAFIRPAVMGSDHCPIGVDLEF